MSVMWTSGYRPESGFFYLCWWYFCSYTYGTKLGHHRIVSGTLWYLTASFSSWLLFKSNFSHQLLLFRFPMSFAPDTPLPIPVLIRLNFCVSLLFSSIFPVISKAKSNWFSLNLSKPGMATLQKNSFVLFCFVFYSVCILSWAVQSKSK